MQRTSIVILGAGQGKRMCSDLPKLLHPLAGRCLLEHVHATACSLPHEAIYVVYGHGGALLRERMSDLDVHWVEQTPQSGTGHALAQALPQIPEEHRVLVLYGDVPLLRAQTLNALLERHCAGQLCLLTAHLDEPDGYGRILRDAQGRPQGIIEHRDATRQQRQLREVNTGVLVAGCGQLRGWLERVGRNNAQGEQYLSDCVALAIADNIPVETLPAEVAMEALGVNDPWQLAQAERHFQARQARALLRDGLMLVDPARFDLRGTLHFDRDVRIDVNVVLEGHVKLGKQVQIGANCVLRDVCIADAVCIQPHCVIEGAEIGNGCRIGPFARIRPHSQLHSDVHVGNFVEVKNSRIDSRSKANHLSYIGDCTVGKETNIGAGVITCNYDGERKHHTQIGDRVFVGSDAQLIAPVRIGDGATVAAGATITRDVAPNALAISRSEQRSIPDWRQHKKRQPS